MSQVGAENLVTLAVRPRAWALSARGLLAGTKMIALSAVGLGFFLVVWYGGHLIIGRFLPTPLAVAQNATLNFYRSRYFVGLGLPEGGYWPHIIATTTTVLEGVCLGGFVGIALGLGSAYSALLRQITAPIASIVGTVPILAAAPFFLMWFGVSPSAKIALVTLYSSFVFYLYALRAIGNVNPRLVEYVRTLGASRRFAFLKVSIPAAVPEVFGGVRVALNGAWSLAAITELLGSTTGIGRVIIAAWGVYDITSIMAGVLLLGMVAMALDACLMALRHWVLRWV